MGTVLVYSSNERVREHVRVALGRRPAADLAAVSYLEADRAAEAVAAVNAGGIDVCILDGEAWPAGGMGISRQLHDEIADCPAIVVLIGREQDRWLASWSLADAVVTHPADPLILAETVARLLRERPARRPVAPVRTGVFRRRRA